MKVLLISPGRQPEEVSIRDDLQAVQAYLGGPVELLQFPLDYAAILYVPSADGANRYFKGRVINGDMLVVGTARNGFKSLTNEQMMRYIDMFRLGGDGEC